MNSAIRNIQQFDADTMHLSNNVVNRAVLGISKLDNRSIETLNIQDSSESSEGCGPSQLPLSHRSRYLQDVVTWDFKHRQLLQLSDALWELSQQIPGEPRLYACGRQRFAFETRKGEGRGRGGEQRQERRFSREISEATWSDSLRLPNLEDYLSCFRKNAEEIAFTCTCKDRRWYSRERAFYFFRKLWVQMAVSEGRL